MGSGWQVNVLLTHVPFGEETKDFLDTLSLVYRRLSLLAPTIIIGDLNAAPTDDDRTGPPTATNIAVRDAMHQLGLTHLTAGLTDTPSNYAHQAGTHPSRIDTCYGDRTMVRVHEATYGDLLPTGTGHRPLYIDLIIPNLPPPAARLPDDTLPPTLRFPAEDDHGAQHRYKRALHAILRRPDAPTLTGAMRRAAQACGMERETSCTEAPQDLTLKQLIHDIRTTDGELATLLRLSTPEARERDAHLCALLTTRRQQLQEWTPGTPGAEAIPLVVRDTPHGWAAPRAAAQRRGHVALPMDTCGDTLPPGTPRPGGRDTAFPSTCGSGLRGT